MLEQFQEPGFYQLAALLLLAAITGGIGLLLRQPMVVSFIAVGLLAGPAGLAIVQSPENIEVLAELGIAVLLFLVGLKLDLKLVRTLGTVALATGLGQVAFTSGIGFLLGLALGLDVVTALYVAVALTFSSTIIIVKLLSDKKEVDSLHGRIALGFLIVQDLVVVLAMMVLSAIGIGGDAVADDQMVGEVLSVLAAGAVMLGLVLVFIRYIANPMVSRIAYSSELLVIFAIAWATTLAMLGSHFGFSKELGGLLAGISLASTPYREAMLARLSSLRDFLLLFFFIALGAQLDLGQLGAQVGPALVFSVFVLVGNPLIVMVIMGVMGFRKRTGFLAGLTVAQISEFSLIFMAMGLSLGHVSSDSLGLVTLVGLITIALSVYMITYSHVLYRWLEPVLGIFERHVAHREEAADSAGATESRYDLILFGAGRYGAAMATKLMGAGYRILVVDFNPDVIKRWRGTGCAAMYGDASDPEFIPMLPLAGVKWVIAAMPQHDLGVTHQDPRLVLIEGLKKEGYQGRIAVAAHTADEPEMLQARGADLVFFPFKDAAHRAVELLEGESVAAAS